MGGIFRTGGGGQSTSTSDNRISAMQIQTSNYGNTIPIVYGTTRVSPNLIYYTDFQAIAHTTTTSNGGGGGKGGGGGGGGSSTNTTYTYTAAVIMSLCDGPGYIGTTWRSKDRMNGAYEAGLNEVCGTIGQDVQPYLQSNHPSEALAYSGITYVYGWDTSLDSNASMYNYTFEVFGNKIYGAFGYDANPADILYDVLTNEQYGAGFDANDFGSLNDYSNFCIASGILISPCYDKQRSGADVVNELATITNSAPVYSDGKLKLVPYQDSSISNGQVDYTPNIRPEYDLNADDLIVKSLGDDPIKVVRKTSADAFNQVQIEFMDRSNDYNIAIATARDQASIEVNKLKPQPVNQFHAICDPVVAQIVANNILQRSLNIKNTYEFTLGWRYSRLEPMDIVTLSDDYLGFNRLPVRIVEVQEDSEGNLSIIAEECNFGTASSAEYPHQSSSGFAHNYKIYAAPVTDPVIFEPPTQLTTSGLQVWAAVSGITKYWGGCSVWTSLDGETYKKQGEIFGGARYGSLTAPLDANNSLSLSMVGLGGQLLTATLQDATTLQTLCMVSDGANTEFLAYQTATLTAENNYTLTNLVRGAYDSKVLNKPIGASFARIDASIAKSGDLDLSLVGKTIYFKFTSFNIYQSNEQSLAEVTAYPYTVTGEMLKIPPYDVTGFTASVVNNGVQLTWNDINDSQLYDYEIRVGKDWDSGESLGFFNGTTTTLPPLALASYDWFIKARNNFMVESTNPDAANLQVTPPNPLTVKAEISGANYVLSWDTPASMFAIDYYSIGIGVNALNVSEISKAKVTQYQSQVDWLGSKAFWVAAVDVAGNVGTYKSVEINVEAPSAPSCTVKVVGNNILLYWTSSSGTLPITTYEISKGATFKGAQSIGAKSGLFTSVFEATAGTYTYWIAAVDSAGNVGAPGAVTAAVSSLVGYVLHSDLFSTFSGNLVNAANENGTGITMPVDQTLTWQQHFVNHGWKNIDDQIKAGYPYYNQPSINSGYYEEVIDYGQILSGLNCTITPTIVTLAGSPSISVNISISNTGLDGSWFDYLNTNSVYLNNFRYLKVRVTANSTDDISLLKMTSLEIKLSAQLQDDAGHAIINANDVNGTQVNFNISYYDVQSISVTAEGSTPLIAMYSFNDVPNPKYFYAFLFDKNGNRVSGAISWSSKGY